MWPGSIHPRTYEVAEHIIMITTSKFHISSNCNTSTTIRNLYHQETILIVLDSVGLN